MFSRPTPVALDISGFGMIPETPRRPPTEAPASLHVLKRPPLEGEYVSVTNSLGSRVYLRQKEDTGTKVNTYSHTSAGLACCKTLIYRCSSLFHSHTYSYLSVSPGSRLQNGTELLWFTGAAGGADKCAETTRSREGE